MKRKLLVAGGVLVVVCAVMLGVLVTPLLNAGKIGTRVEVVQQERCAKFMNVKYFRNRLGFLTATYTRAVYVLSDGRELDYHAFMDGNDGQGNFCDTVYVPAKQAARRHTEIADRVSGPRGIPIEPDRQQDVCRSWDWDFSPPQGSIGFRCIDPAR